jgi:hypothetical protein
LVNLFDIVQQAQSGLAMENFSRQFGLNPDQTKRAVDALLPAFSLGFQRSMTNPSLFAPLLEMMASGRYAPFFDGSGQGNLLQSSGQQVLDRLFGSSDLSRHVAGQASAMTGIGAQVLQQMMPSLAAILMGGLFRQTNVRGLSDFLRAWSDWLRTMAPPDRSRTSASAAAGTPYGAWMDLMGTMMGGKAAKPKPEPPAPADPWASFMQAFTKSMPQAAAVPPPPPPPPSQPNPFQVLSQMFEGGREVQSQYVASLQAMFDGSWRPQAGGGSPLSS